MCFSYLRKGSICEGGDSESSAVVETSGMEEETCDRRSCQFCLSKGDRAEKIEGRLLYCGQDEWVHTNCAFWSDEVVESINGLLQKVNSAINRGKTLRCSFCKEHGATISCHAEECQVNYHFLCGRQINCVFFASNNNFNKRVFCYQHKSLASSVGSNFSSVKDFRQRKRLQVDLEDNQTNALSATAEVKVQIGSLAVRNIGDLSSLSDEPKALYPVSYSVSRLYWSSKDPRKRTLYHLTISEMFPSVPVEPNKTTSTSWSPLGSLKSDSQPTTRSRRRAHSGYVNQFDVVNACVGSCLAPIAASLDLANVSIGIFTMTASASEQHSLMLRIKGSVDNCCPLCGGVFRGEVSLFLHFSRCDSVFQAISSRLQRFAASENAESLARSGHKKRCRDSVVLKMYLNEEERRARQAAADDALNEFSENEVIAKTFSTQFASSRKKNTNPYLMYKLESDDGFLVESRSLSAVWKAVSLAVCNARSDAGIVSKLSEDNLDPLRLSGLTLEPVSFLLEQLPGAKHCCKYQFKFFHTSAEPLPVNLTGTARTEGVVRRRCEKTDMFSWLSSSHRPVPTQANQKLNDTELQISIAHRRKQNAELPAQLRYRHLKKTAPEVCAVFKSRIHGRGLFCLQTVYPGEMVIEYTGQIIRSSLCDLREKYYQSRGIGCYMFRMDNNFVIDATLSGNAARFINHSCDPNCYSRVLVADNRKHIIIFALKQINRGEELTYDYKFEIEDDTKKLSCLCNTGNCRRFLN